MALHQLEKAVAGTPSEGLASMVQELFGTDEEDMEIAHQIEEEHKVGKRKRAASPEAGPAPKVPARDSGSQLMSQKKQPWAVPAPNPAVLPDPSATVRRTPRPDDPKKFFYGCSICPAPEPFGLKTSFATVQKHLNTHHLGVVLQCPFCATTSPNPDVISKHVGKEHPEKKGTSATPPPSVINISIQQVAGESSAPVEAVGEALEALGSVLESEPNVQE